MSNHIYITASEPNAGKTCVTLGMLQMLVGSKRKVAFFRPIVQERADGAQDGDTALMLKHFKLKQKYADSFGCTLPEALRLVQAGKRDALIATILRAFRQLAAKYDVVLCEGTGFFSDNTPFTFDLNCDIAANLGCKLVAVTNCHGKSAEGIVESAHMLARQLAARDVDALAIVLNRVDLRKADATRTLTRLRKELEESLGARAPLACALPNEAALARPTLADVQKWLDAKVLVGRERLETQISDFLVAAMQAPNFLEHLGEGHLVLTPGDRADVVLAAVGAHQSSACPNPAGILLTGNLKLAANVQKLLEGCPGKPLPVLLTREHTAKALQILLPRQGGIDGDARKVATAIKLFEANVDLKECEARLFGADSARVTPIMFEFNLLERARSNKMRIVLAEGEEERILRATETLLQREVAEIFLIGDDKNITKKAKALGVDIKGATLVNPKTSPWFKDYADTYLELRKAKGMTPELARERMQDNTYFATMMVHKGHADGMVSGAINTTAHTIRPAFEFIKTKPGFSVVSSVFLMCLKDRVLAFGDCAVNPNPTAQQLAEIAVASAHTAKVFGIEPRVAMLSYSTGSSGKGADVDVVIEATRLAREMAPDLPIEGPIQYDAAISPDVARTKLPDSKVAGRATVFIFPDLNTGNNTYKAVQRAANAIAIGPVLQGLNKPVNDLSRGCLVPDIVNTVAITAVQAAAEKQHMQK